MTWVLSIVSVAGLAWFATTAGAAPAARGAAADTTMIELGSASASAPAFVAWPAKRRGASAILIADEAAPTSQVRDLARRFAREGYVAIVPATAAGEDDPEIATAGLARLEAACTWVRAQPDLKGAKIGALGVGDASGTAVRLGLRGNASAVVVWYGPFTIDPSALGSLRAPLQAHLGADDPAAPAAWVSELRQALGGRAANVHVYAGAGAAFMSDRGDGYHADAARQAWARTLAFLQKHLKD